VVVGNMDMEGIHSAVVDMDRNLAASGIVGNSGTHPRVSVRSICHAVDVALPPACLQHLGAGL